jgi:cysteine desulfurase
MAQPVYLDYNATTPLDPAVAKAIEPCLGPLFGNPSSPHTYGIEAKRAVEHARAQVADMLSCVPTEVIFTSGGTEANNLAILGVAEALRDRGHHIITSAIEHPAVIEPCRWLEQHGFDVTVLPVDEHGLIAPETVAAALRDDTILVTVMHANNEVGTIEPIADIAKLAHKAGALVHTDAAQTVGKVPVAVDELGVDLLSVAGHKLYAPKGVGALYVREGTPLLPFTRGATHERGLRPGTENLIGTIGLGAAAALVAGNLEGHASHMATMRDRLQEGLLALGADLCVHGHPTQRLPNTLSVGFRDMDATDLLVELIDDVAASAGAACHSNELSVSDTLKAMQVPLAYARGTLRFSVGRFTEASEIDRAIAAIARALAESS